MVNHWTPKTFILVIAVLYVCCSAGARHCSAVELDTDGDIYLIVRSDDMGMTHAVNQACLRTVTDGIARSIEVIVPAPWFAEAAQMLQKHPEVDVGVHLDLTAEWSAIKWGPVSPGVPSLVDENGHFFPTTRQSEKRSPNTGFLESGWKIGEVERELRAQIETAKRMLPNVTHLSAHMGTATCTPELKSLVDFLAKEYELPIQIPNLNRAPRWRSKPANPKEAEAEMIKLLEDLQPGLWLFVEHPGLNTPEMKAITHLGNDNVNEERAAVTHAFLCDRVNEVVRRRGIKLISYADALKME